MNMKIFVSTFGNKIMYVPCGEPIEVGAASRNSVKYRLRDDIGENISFENPYFGELTGLYWIWKNCDLTNLDYIGFCHYNKKLNISKKEIVSVLSSGKGWVVANKLTIPEHSDKNEWDAMLSVLESMFPEYYKMTRKIYNENGGSDVCNCANMFITTPVEFEKYCEFLFSILLELRKRLGNNEKTPSEKRYCAFMGERLLTVYLLTNKIPFEEKEIIYNKVWMNGIIDWVSKLPMNKNSKWYRGIKKIILGNSSISSYER